MTSVNVVHRLCPLLTPLLTSQAFKCRAIDLARFGDEVSENTRCAVQFRAGAASSTRRNYDSLLTSRFSFSRNHHLAIRESPPGRWQAVLRLLRTITWRWRRRWWRQNKKYIGPSAFRAASHQTLIPPDISFPARCALVVSLASRSIHTRFVSRSVRVRSARVPYTDQGTQPPCEDRSEQSHTLRLLSHGISSASPDVRNAHEREREGETDRARFGTGDRE